MVISCILRSERRYQSDQFLSLFLFFGGGLRSYLISTACSTIIFMTTRFLPLILLLHIALACSDGCNTCDPFTNTCYTCADPSFFRLNDGRCLKATGASTLCTIYAINGSCVACLPTYKLTQAQCIKDTSGCLSFNGDQCLSCGFGTVLVSGKCTGILNCLVFDQASKNCTSCAPGLVSQGTMCSVTNGCTSSAQNGGCLQCSGDYVLSGFICVAKNIPLPGGCGVMDYNGKCQYCWNGNLPDSVLGCLSGGVRVSV